jgi:hypothetical protein
MSRKRKTSGTEFMILSVSAFNGSGYADYTSTEDYIDSYVKYKQWRGKPQDAMQADANRELLRPFVDNLLATSYGAGRTPALKRLEAFKNFQGNTRLL